MNAADILAAHRFGYSRDEFRAHATCTCCFWSIESQVDGLNVDKAADFHAAHVLAELAAAGFAVVKLPEGNADEGYTTFGPGAFVGTDGFVYTGECDYLPSEAREIAAALLAAAAAAEAGER